MFYAQRTKNIALETIIPEKKQIMIVSRTFPLLFFDVAFEKEGSKMFFYFIKVNSFQIFAKKKLVLSHSQ